jgi:hypothetical protein
MRGIRLLLLGVLVGACKPYLAEPLALNVTIQADRSVAAPGDSIQFDIRAQGGNLLGIAVGWGDGETLQIQTLGAQTSRSFRRHAFREPGVYDVTAVVTDDAAGSKSAGLRIRIQ